MSLNKIEELGLFKEDLEQYKVIFENWETMVSDDGNAAYELSKMSLVAADRWNEISFNAKKIATDHHLNKTDLQQWAYHRYRLLMTLHDHTRVVWRQCSENVRSRMND